MHAHLIPSFYLDRVASTRAVTAGESLRALAERLRTPLFAPDGAFGALSPMEQDQLKDKAKALAEVFQRWGQAHPLGRIGTPEEVAELAAFLASERASFCTGGDYLVDGGLLAGIGVQ